jgi:hypothetical protein
MAENWRISFCFIVFWACFGRISSEAYQPSEKYMRPTECWVSCFLLFRQGLAVTNQSFCIWNDWLRGVIDELLVLLHFFLLYFLTTNE